MSETAERLDRYLFHTRLVKTRSLAQRLCAAGRVKLNGRVAARPAQPVKPGDVIGLDHGGAAIRLEVLCFSDRRGPAAEARALYRELDRSRLAPGDPDWAPLLTDEEETAG